MSPGRCRKKSAARVATGLAGPDPVSWLYTSGRVWNTSPFREIAGLPACRWLPLPYLAGFRPERQRTSHRDQDRSGSGPVPDAIRRARLVSVSAALISKCSDPGRAGIRENGRHLWEPAAQFFVRKMQRAPLLCHEVAAVVVAAPFR